MSKSQEFDPIFISRLLSRFNVLRGRRPDSTGWAELASAIRKCTAIEERATALVDRWIETHYFIPTPCELLELSREMGNPHGAGVECERCGGTGYEQVWELRKKDPRGKLISRERITATEAQELSSSDPRVLSPWSVETIAECASLCTCPAGEEIAEARACQAARKPSGFSKSPTSNKRPTRAGDIIDLPLFRVNE